MKIIGGVPTRWRDTAGPIADVLATVCDKVLIVSQEAEICSEKPNVIVENYPPDIGLVKARNIILDFAEQESADYIIQSDDDLRFKPNVLQKMIEIVTKENYLAGVASCPDVYYHWEANIQTSKDWILTSSPEQLWIIRAKAIKEAGKFDTELAEDAEYGLRLWNRGWVIGRLHCGRSFTHKPFVQRVGKGNVGGGQLESERDEKFDAALKSVRQRYPELIYTFERSYAKQKTIDTRFRWKVMCEKARERWGEIDYTDSRGRFI